MKLIINQLLLKGVKEHKKNNFGEAERLYKIILNSDPQHPDANHNLGIIKKKNDKLNEAELLFKIAIQSNSEVEQFWVSYIETLISNKKPVDAKKLIKKAKKKFKFSKKFDLFQSKIDSTNINKEKFIESKNLLTDLFHKFIENLEKQKLIEAEKTAQKISEEFPDNHNGWKALGLVFKKTGRIKESITALEKAVNLCSYDGEIFNNLAASLIDLKRFDEAEIYLRKALKLKPNYTTASINLGKVLTKLKKFAEAENILKKMKNLEPENVEVLNSLGVCLIDLGKMEEAEQLLKCAIKLKPDFTSAYNNLTRALRELNKDDECEKYLKKIIRLNPNEYRPFVNLCALLENQNRLDEAQSIIKNFSLKSNKLIEDIMLWEALISFRKDDLDNTEKLINNIDINKISENQQFYFLKLKGELHEKKKQFNDAFECFHDLSVYKKKIYKDYEENKNYWFNSIRQNNLEIQNFEKKTNFKPKIKAKWYQPCFLVGFPRSGTTLLDTILRSHSDIDVLEEKEMIPKLKKNYNNLLKISEIENIEESFAENLKKLYFSELEKYFILNENKIFIDKLPFNLIHIPLINQVFPRSKIILSIRHPFDCILSCWIQNFKINSAMANLIDLDRTVDTYCESMNLFKLSKKRYSLNVHMVRYEDLIYNFETEVHKILNFLNLKWEDNLYNYQKTAFDRKNINTPSYKQVIKKIYKTSAYRWKNYQKYLEPFRQKLQPWINEYGYLE